MYQKENPLYIKLKRIPICKAMKSNLKLKLDTNQITPTQFSRVTRTIEKLEKALISSKNIDEITSDECNTIIMGNKTKTYAGKTILPISDFLYL